MSIFICSSCDQYRDADIHGCEEDTYDAREISCLCEDCAVCRKDEIAYQIYVLA